MNQTSNINELSKFQTDELTDEEIEELFAKNEEINKNENVNDLLKFKTDEEIEELFDKMEKKSENINDKNSKYTLVEKYIEEANKFEKIPNETKQKKFRRKNQYLVKCIEKQFSKINLKNKSVNDIFLKIIEIISNKMNEIGSVSIVNNGIGDKNNKYLMLCLFKALSKLTCINKYVCWKDIIQNKLGLDSNLDFAENIVKFRNYMNDSKIDINDFNDYVKEITESKLPSSKHPDLNLEEAVNAGPLMEKLGYCLVLIHEEFGGFVTECYGSLTQGKFIYLNHADGHFSPISNKLRKKLDEAILKELI
jgi:hypothetical protein